MGEQFAGGVELMFIGMGIVFVFLAMLVVAVNLMSLVIARFFPEVPATTHAAAGTLPAATAEEEVVAVISAAIHRHRNDRSA